MQLENVTARPIEIGHRKQAPKALRLAFSFPVAIAALLTVLTVLTVRSRFNDPDLWWHLKTGEIIWNTHVIPAVDTFSYTAAGHAWVAQEWLSQLAFYGAWKFDGNTGLMLLLCAMASLILISGYALCAAYSGNAKVAFLGAMAVWLFSTVGLAIRPHMIGYLLLIFELLVLHLGRSRDPKWFFALPPLFCVWINCHGSFFFGLAVAGVVSFCSFWDFRLGLLACERWDKQNRNALLIALAICVAALFVNPVGPKLIAYPLDVLFNQHVNLNAVSEWQPPHFDSPRGLALLAVAALTLLLPIFRHAEITLQELLLLTLGFGFAVRHERMLFVFGLLVAPILCRLLSETWEKYRPEQDRILPNAVMVALASAVAIIAFPGRSDLDHQVETGNPVKALEFIRHSGFSGRMLNEYVYGGYLIWAAPEQKVFLDGRADIYDPAGLLAEYGNWAMLQQDPQRLLAKYQIDFCLLSREAPMGRVLPLLPGWKRIYADQLSSVYARSGSQIKASVAKETAAAPYLVGAE